jgi:hypothetical protein
MAKPITAHPNTREHQTHIGPADYALFIEKQACGVIEAKKQEMGQNSPTVEDIRSSIRLHRSSGAKRQQPKANCNAAEGFFGSIPPHS